MQEFFDVLNEKGQYINQIETRETCHTKGLWHKAVAVFIINSKKQVLLQKRSPYKKLWPNYWDITAGGHVLAGEFGFQAIIREIKEELGLTLLKNDMLFIGSSISCDTKNEIINKHFNEFYIINKDIDISKLTLQTEEVTEVKWINKDEIIKKIKNNYEGITNKEGCWEYLVKYYEWDENNNIL